MAKQMNEYFKKMNAARKKGAKSFSYKGATYVGTKTNNKSNQQYNPNDDYSEDEVPPPNDFIPKLRPPKINVLNV